jgi:hypothetical protein
MRKYWVVQKITPLFLKFLFIAYDVWKQSEREGLKLDALEVVRQGFVDLVKRSDAEKIEKLLYLFTKSTEP